MPIPSLETDPGTQCEDSLEGRAPMGRKFIYSASGAANEGAGATSAPPLPARIDSADGPDTLDGPCLTTNSLPLPSS